jgi:cytochrome c biogenesis protein CcdA
MDVSMIFINVGMLISLVMGIVGIVMIFGSLTDPDGWIAFLIGAILVIACSFVFFTLLEVLRDREARAMMSDQEIIAQLAIDHVLALDEKFEWPPVAGAGTL